MLLEGNEMLIQGLTVENFALESEFMEDFEKPTYTVLSPMNVSGVPQACDERTSVEQLSLNLGIEPPITVEEIFSSQNYGGGQKSDYETFVSDVVSQGFEELPGETNSSNVEVHITEQPASTSVRFRYACEGRSAGSIYGKSSAPESRTFPGIRVSGLDGDAIAVVSCVTMEDPSRAHPHRLLGRKDAACVAGVCVKRLEIGRSDYSFRYLGIQCVRKKDIAGSLQERAVLGLEGEDCGERTEDDSEVNLNCVRLLFRVFSGGDTSLSALGRRRLLGSAYSDPIWNRNSLKIEYVSHSLLSPLGGERVVVLCDKINKDDLEVRLSGSGWTASGSFGANDVRHGHSVVFTTPPCPLDSGEQRVVASLQLWRPSDNSSSNAVKLEYYREERDTVPVDKVVAQKRSGTERANVAKRRKITRKCKKT